MEVPIMNDDNDPLTFLELVFSILNRKDRFRDSDIITTMLTNKLLELQNKAEKILEIDEVPEVTQVSELQQYFIDIGKKLDPLADNYS
jgi:hypothetical protein